MNRQNKIKAILAVNVKSIVANFDINSKNTSYTLIASDNKSEYFFNIGEYQTVTAETEEYINKISSYISSQNGKIEVMTYLRNPMLQNDTKHAVFYLDSSYDEPSELIKVLGLGDDEEQVNLQVEPETANGDTIYKVEELEEPEKMEDNELADSDEEQIEIQDSENAEETDRDKEDEETQESEGLKEEVAEDIKPEVSNQELYESVSKMENNVDQFKEPLFTFSDQVLSFALITYPRELVAIFNAIVLDGKQRGLSYQAFKKMYGTIMKINEKTNEIVFFSFFNGLPLTNPVKQLYTDAIGTFQEKGHTIEQLQDYLIKVNEYFQKEQVNEDGE